MNGFSSRHIQWCCQSDIIFKALSCDTSPDFTTIAAFVSGHFMACNEQGLIVHDLIAIDGCKLPSNAAKEWSGTLEELAHKRDKLKKQIVRKLDEHTAKDKLPSDVQAQERQRKVQKTFDTLKASHDKVSDFLDTAEPR